MKLVLDPDPSLREICTDIEFPTLQEAIDSFEIMKANDGAGISAPQVGSQKRFFWMKDELVIHPVLLGCDKTCARIVEGCLSLPGQHFSVVRALSIVVSYHTLIGLRKEVHLCDMDAIIFQHEYDHLDGVMIDDGRYNESRLP